MSRKTVVAASRPAKGMEMRSIEIPAGDLQLMRVLAQQKLQSDNVPDEKLFESVKKLRLPTNETGGIYHEIYKANQRFLVPDYTLKEMEKIVNSKLTPKKSVRFKNEIFTYYPDNAEVLPGKLDEILDILDRLDLESDIIPEKSSSVSNVSRDPSDKSRTSNISEELEPETLLEKSAHSSRASSVILVKSEGLKTSPPISEIGPMALKDYGPSHLAEHLKCLPFPLTDLDEVTYSTSDEIKNKKLHFRILGHYKDLSHPKLKIQKINYDPTCEPTKNNDEINIQKFNFKHSGTKLHISITTKFFKKASEEFLKTFYDSDQSELVDTFNIVHKVHSVANTASECALSISGKFVSDTVTKTILPVLSIRVNKKGAATGTKIPKQISFKENKKSRESIRVALDRPKTKKRYSNVIVEEIEED